MKKLTITVLSIIIFCSCNKEKFFDGPDYFQDGFEAYATLNDLLLPHDQLWSLTQITKPENHITVDIVNFHSGKRALKFVAAKSDDNVSKCSIVKHNMAFWEGEVVRASAWYYMKGTQSAQWLFLMDLEEQTAVGAGPGMRLTLDNNRLRVEYKFLESDILQNPGQEVSFPRDQWVEIIWEMKLSQKKKGYVKLWQNGQLIIDSKNNTTLPKDILYFLQGTKGMYSSAEIGITANSKDNDLTLWVDDFKVEKVK